MLEEHGIPKDLEENEDYSFLLNKVAVGKAQFYSQKQKHEDAK